MFRLKQKHTPDKRKKLPPADGRRLLAEQSVLRGFFGGVAVALLLCWGWALFAMSTDRVFPWFSIPIGALIGSFVLRSFFSDATFGVIFASVAGVMVYISLDELLPTAEEYGEHHLAIGGLIGGMLSMAVSLFLFV